MPSDGRRAPRLLPRAGACAGALLFVLLFLAEGCRDNGTGPSVQSPLTVSGLVFAPGDTLTFDTWGLDPYNYTIPASHVSESWSVSAVKDSFAGAGNVTSIVELPAPGGFPAGADTLHFRFLPSGDIYEYGFIANVLRRREGVSVPPAWDRIAAFSLPTNAVWSVGTVDSGGTDTLRGMVMGDQQYFIAVLNGVRTAFHGYGVSLSSLDIDYTLVVSDNPPAVLLLQELSTPVANGFLWNLASLRKH